LTAVLWWYETGVVGDVEADLRERLRQVGLADRADELFDLAVLSIRFRGRGEERLATMLTRPPAPVWGLGSSITAIAGSYHNLALRGDGTVVGWGENRVGQVGDGTSRYRRAPVRVVDLVDVAAVSVGEAHSLALTERGGVVAWGRNEWGELGDGTLTSSGSPAGVGGLERGVVAVAAGDFHSLALTVDGAVLAWGLNSAGEVGRDYIPAGPVAVPELQRGVRAIAAGGYHSLALTEDGTVLAWGMAGMPGLGEFGGFDLSRPPYIARPAPVSGLPRGIQQVAAGKRHSLALTSSGGVFAWGDGHSGQLGDGARENRYPAVEVSGLSSGVRAIAAGYNCSYSISGDGALLSWGWNFEGQLGDGGTDDRLAPAPVAALHGTAAAISDRLALMDDRSVRAWGGEYPADQLGTGARLELGSTKLGGRPDLRQRSRWPSRGGRPLAFVAQIDLAQLAPLDPSGLLPPSGLLSFFYGDPAGPLEPESCAVIFTEPGAQLSRRDFPDALPDDAHYATVALEPELELTLPPRPPTFLTDQERDAYQWELDELADQPRHRMLGHPDPVQNDPRQADAELVVLQIDADEGARMTWGDIGRLYYLIQPTDLKARRFQASRCELQSH
jgi:Domain of unknown function (DUF1963)/Regulator of chromosome condensation (RCC1) repeat